MSEHYDVWIIHAKREVLFTDLPGPPAIICGYVSEEARRSAEACGYATVSEIGFPRDCHKGFTSYAEASKWAADVAQGLGYTVKYSFYWDGGLDDDFDDEHIDWADGEF